MTFSFCKQDSSGIFMTCLQMLTNPLLVEGNHLPLGPALFLQNLILNCPVRWWLRHDSCRIDLDFPNIGLVVAQMFIMYYSCGTVALYGLFINFFFLADHRATDFTRSQICGAATKNTSHLSTVFFTTKRFVRAGSCGQFVSLHIYLSLSIFTYSLLLISNLLS